MQQHDASRFEKHIDKPGRFVRLSKHKGVLTTLSALAILSIPTLALAQDTHDSGDTAWMLTSTALVLL